MRSVVALGVLLLLGGSALAQDCSNPSTQDEINTCAHQSFEAADAELNQKYKEIIERLGRDSDAPFVAAQRAWIGFRDAECAFVASRSEGGSIQPTIRSSCLEGITKKRVADFDAYLACEEGDLSCPAPAD